jgi:tripartite ATP-independent transporter DctP family solute receptor
LISFKELVEKESNGRINVQVHHSGSLYNSAGAFDAIRRGEVEMTFVSAAVLSDLMPKLAMFSSGYFYKDYKHMRAVLGGDIGTQLSAEIASTTGIRPIASFYLGSRHLNLRNIGRIVRTPDDLKGVKLRMPDAAPWLFLGRALGANPTPIAFGELYMALSTGTVDGQDNPLPLTESGKFFEVTHSISLTGHIVDSTFLVVNESFWKQLPDDLKRIVAGAAQTVERNVDKTTLDAESRLVDFFRSKGLVIVEPDKSAFRSRVQSAYLNDAQATKSWDLELFKRIQSLGE